MKARILVIEDEMSINDLLCMNLEIAGYETVGYLDGNEAYEAIIQDHAFQCALVDIMLTDLRWIYETLNKDLFSDYMYHSVGIVRDFSLYHLLLEKSEYTEYQQL